MRNDLSEMAVASSTLDSIGSRFAVPGKALLQLQVALDEALSNIVKYAWPEGGEHKVLIRFTAASDYLQIRIIDDGQPFDMRQSKLVKPSVSGKKLAYGGRGISMIKQLVDRIEYSRINNRNHLTLSKNLTES